MDRSLKIFIICVVLLFISWIAFLILSTCLGPPLRHNTSRKPGRISLERILATWAFITNVTKAQVIVIGLIGIIKSSILFISSLSNLHSLRLLVHLIFYFNTNLSIVKA
ncbi:hypothetical protein PSHT_13552 [Puccinia striiformis]|uniref:Uncharacterized protein n=1 Tax=Puccinia striiformis TaxID=27350 RepID=A0A2S4UQF7_9BASI|nr:hypothetical protein PSHT_13552 [Puccinia striiformis]